MACMRFVLCKYNYKFLSSKGNRASQSLFCRDTITAVFLFPLGGEYISIKESLDINTQSTAQWEQEPTHQTMGAL